MGLFSLFGKQDLKKSPNGTENEQKEIADVKIEGGDSTGKAVDRLGRFEEEPHTQNVVFQEKEAETPTILRDATVNVPEGSETDQQNDEMPSIMRDEASDETPLLASLPKEQKDTEGVDICNENFLPQSMRDNSSIVEYGNTEVLQKKNDKDSDIPTPGEKKKRYVVGDVGGTFYQIPYFAKKSDEGVFHRNDIVADIAKMGNLLVMGASLRGESHYAHKIPRQDSFLIEECNASDRKFVIAAIADGVGNAKKADEFSEMLVNFLCDEVSNELHRSSAIERLDWEKISEKIWKISINYCYQKSGSKNIDEYFQNWASTLECVVIDAQQENEAGFIAVTISGDGGIYKLDALQNWIPVKRGKTGNNTAVSNLVYCLPDRPINTIIRKGCLKKGEKLFIVTDGLSDYIEEYEDIRQFFGSKLPNFVNLPEFIKVLNVAVKQMDDDKTGVLISYYNESS